MRLAQAQLTQSKPLTVPYKDIGIFNAPGRYLFDKRNRVPRQRIDADGLEQNMITTLMLTIWTGYRPWMKFMSNLI